MSPRSRWPAPFDLRRALLDRRRFLRIGGALTGSAALGLACGTGSTGSVVRPDAASSADAAPGNDPGASADGGACRVTTADVEGPFFEDGAPMRAKIAADDEPGERLLLDGQVLAADCITPLAGTAIEVWQADRDGNYHGAGEDFRLRGRIVTDAEGRFIVDTVRPGNYTLAADSWRPAHVHFMFARAGHESLTTQIYFAGDPYLPPNDGCTGCGSDDPDRILALTGSAAAGWTGTLRIVLAAA